MGNDATTAEKRRGCLVLLGAMGVVATLIVFAAAVLAAR